MLFLKLNKQVVICHWWTSHSIFIICFQSQSLVCGRFKDISIFFSLWTNLIFICLFSCRGYYIIIVPLKKSRGKFIKPWESPDEMELDEVTVFWVVSFISYLIFKINLSSLWRPFSIWSGWISSYMAGWSTAYLNGSVLWAC